MYKTHALYIVLEGLGWSQDHPKPSNKSIAKDSQASKGPLSGKQRIFVRQAKDCKASKRSCNASAGLFSKQMRTYFLCNCPNTGVELVHGQPPDS